LADAVLDDAGHLLLFRLEDDDETRALWPHPFIAELEVRLGRTLTLTLRIRNRGSQPLHCSFALHSYFAVADVRETIVIGLTDTTYHDQLAPALGDQQQDCAVLGFSAETDRIYPRARGVYQIQSLSAQAAPINISAPAGSSVVIWNPWQDKAARLGDMPADDWQHMLCVECGQLASEVLDLRAGQTTEFTMTLTGLQR
jgi:D-hexose-6-phosphate mutarotase